MRKSEINQLRQQLVELQQEVGSLQSGIAASEARVATAESSKASELAVINAERATEKVVWESEKTALVAGIKDLQAQLSESKNTINQMQLKLMASAYESQESDYKSDVSKWERILLASGVALVASLGITISFAMGRAWYDRVEIYLVDFIFISAVWFCASQYSYYVRLRDDYANRKTLAQSYHNILLSIGKSIDPAEIEINEKTKKLFMEKATGVLCASGSVKAEEALLTQHILKVVVPLVKELTKGKLAA